MSRISRLARRTSGGIFDIAAKKEELKRLEEQSGAADFWNDSNTAKAVLKKVKDLKRVIEPWEVCNREAQDVLELYQMAVMEKDEVSQKELVNHVADVEKKVLNLEFMRKLGGPDDAAATFLMIHSGAGGTESCDWTEMLYRMYTRYLERKGWAFSVVDIIPGDEAGLRSVTLEVNAEFAYGYLKAEQGVHRLVRISPFDSNARRHTSFSSVAATPILEEAEDIVIDDEDLRVDTYRSGGAGGQHVNKTDSAIRITHLPTNIVVQCQNERSQIKNRSTAMKMLKAKLRQKQKDDEEKVMAEKVGVKKKIEWGSQIRSYVLHPYQMVKDHRTDIETSNTQGVLDGEIEMFIEAYLLQFA
jgi:peptide chain release factor 2